MSLDLPPPPSSQSLLDAIELLARAESGPQTAFQLPDFPEFDNDPFPESAHHLSPVPSPIQRRTPRSKSPPPNALEWLHASLPPELAGEALEILQSPSSDSDIAGTLLELYGFERVEYVSEAVTKRSEILAALAALEHEDVSPADTVRPPELTYSSHPDVPPHRPHAAPPEERREHTPGAQVTFHTTADLAELKRARKAARQHKGKEKENQSGIDLEEWERIRQEQLARGPGALVSGNRARVEDAVQYPHVYLSSATAVSGNLGFGGQRLAMSAGTERKDMGEYEEIIIPAPKAVPFRFNEALLPIAQMDLWGQRTFHAYKTLNRLQSIVFPVAYNTNENMLVCAPTGAGKTDVALLTILRCLSSLTSSPISRHASPSLPPPSSYKIIYVAPLKALAAEITLKFSKRLSWAGVKVRELTGDMKLTKKEIDETGVIVTTPEKWDVVTRKGAGSGDGEVADKVKLLIIDEVHLLHEDRGAVIESIVARTLRQVESSQNLIRIVGLSATLPNYVDVADFLRVNRYQGLFYFDASFRPVPLEQHFVGVKGKAGSVSSRTALDNATFEKVAQLLKDGHQVMVFVHARKDTVKTAEMLREKAQAEGIIDLLDPKDSDRYPGFKREMASSRNREMKELAESGFGIHHAGMLRSDRSITERMFETNVTKVLCCTATLAWGVNLPAYAVIIKGTQIYDSNKGAFVDLSILDVLQIFGRAGRPQYEDQGVGYICTTADKLDHYVSAIAQQHPIESKFIEGLVDALNAEISLGTVTNTDEGVRWLGYSYLFVRMRKNPLVYGMLAEEVQQDPLIGSKRLTLITSSAKRLVECRMVKYDPDLGTLEPTDLGRIASRYYIRNASIEIFNARFQPRMGEAAVLELIAASVEFEQINVRENEVLELAKLNEMTRCEVKGPTNTSPGKVNVLLQTFISKAYVEDFALVSDMGYVAQNGARIVRALLEISMSNRWARTTLALMAMSKAIEKRLWPLDNPLLQFDLPADLSYNIARWADDYSTDQVAAMTDAEFGAIVHLNERLGGFATSAARQLPALLVEHSLQPLAHDLLRIRLHLEPHFEWSEKRHGTSEAFWVWIEDESQLTILQVARVLVRPTTTSIRQEFIIPIATVPAALHIRVVSDRWFTDDAVYTIPTAQLVMPPEPSAHLPLLHLPLLSTRETFKDPTLRSVYAADSPVFDPVQTQAFHTFHHTASNALVCAPSAQSRGPLLELAIWRAFSNNPNARIIFLTPRKPLAVLVAIRLRKVFASALKVIPVILSRAQDIACLKSDEPFIAVASPTLLRHLDGSPRQLGNLDLIVGHDLHALESTYELLLSRLRWANPTTRVVGSSSSLQDASDLASWLGVSSMATYSFSPSTRSSALVTSFQSFSTPHSMSLLRSMVKPAYAAMRVASGSTICFVPSRSQCRSTAKDLVTQTASDLDGSFVADGQIDIVASYAHSISDPDIAEALSHGIAVFHEGLKPIEQRVALELFGAGAVRVLIASREACWTLPVHASLIVVLSAQFAAISSEHHERSIEDYTLPEILQMQALAVPPSVEASAGFLILCQKDQSELYSRFLHLGGPLESSLAIDSVLLDTLFVDLVEGRIGSRQDVVDFLSWTFLARRGKSNPAYYAGLASTGSGGHLSRFADRLLEEFESRCCLLFNGATDVQCSNLGKALKVHGFALRDLEALQQLHLDDLLEASAPAGAADTPATNGVLPDEALVSFYTRLPRATKDLVGAQSNDPAFHRRVLLAAFLTGRVPRGAGGRLEAEQTELITQLLQRRKTS